MKEYKIWSKEEISFLISNCTENTVEQLAKLLNRTKPSVRFKLRKLGLSTVKDKPGLDYKLDLIGINYIKNNYLNKTNKELAKILQVHESTIANNIKLLSLSRKFTHNDSFFKEPTLLNSYWAGFIAADGSVGKYTNCFRFQLTLSEKDINHLLEFKRDINAYDSNLSYKISQSPKTGRLNPQWSLYLKLTKDEFESLKKWGIVQNKTLIFQPRCDLSYNNALAFIKGYIDGDGSIHKQGNGSIIGTFELCSWIKETLDINNKISKKGNIYTICIPKEKIIAIKKSISNKGLERKWSRIND